MTTDPEKLGIRREVRLFELAKVLGKTTHVVAEELKRRGVPVMGTSQRRTVFIDDVVRDQNLREKEALEAMGEREA